MLKTCELCSEIITGRKDRRYCDKCKHKNSYKRYYYRNKAKYAARRAQWRADNPLRTKFLYAKADTKRRQRSLTISYEDLLKLWEQPCHYCNKDIRAEKGISLDRIDNSKDYVIGNVLTCCGDCNSIRGDRLTVEEMEVAMKAVLEFRKVQMIGDVQPLEGKTRC